MLKGAYVLWDAAPEPAIILIATGSEVQATLDAAHALQEKGIAARVVSMPSWDLFDAQPRAYRDSVLPPAIRARVSVEAGRTLGWERYVGLDGVSIGVDTFGASAPYQRVYQEYGITAEHIVAEAEALVKAASQ